MSKHDMVFARAVAAYQQGDLVAAERSCRQVLRAVPRHWSALYLSGIIALQSNRVNEGVVFLRRATDIQKSDPGLLVDFGKSLVLAEMPEAALEPFAAAMAIEPDNADAHTYLGAALSALARYDESLGICDRAVAISPRDPHAHNHRGVALFNLDRPLDALSAYDLALGLLPAFPEALNNRGKALAALDRLDEALVTYDRAIALKPDFIDARVGRSAVLRDLERSEEALGALDIALALSPGNVAINVNRAMMLLSLKRHEEAIAAADLALEVEPAHPQALLNKGSSLMALHRPLEAIETYDLALAVRPDYAEVWTSRANALAEVGKYEDALAGHKMALSLKSSYFDAQWNLGHLQLKMGNLVEGWAGYEARKFRRKPLGVRYIDRPALAPGADVKGKTVLLHWEQGLGDTIQFIRYAPLLKKQGANVCLQVQPALRRLIQSMDTDIAVIDHDIHYADFDYHASIMSLPYIFGTDLDSIPAGLYLRAQQDDIEYWSPHGGAPDRKAIGIVFSGSTVHLNDARRSMPVEAVSRLLSLPFEWTCLQKDMRESDRTTLANTGLVRLLSDQIGDFAHTAGLVHHMDLVISVDTSVAHLAAAMGKTVWLLTPYHGEWRWLRDRSDSPWYPGMLIFRQREPGDWDQVIDDVQAALGEDFAWDQSQAAPAMKS